MKLKLKELTLGIALASVSAGVLAYNETEGRSAVHDGLGDVGYAAGSKTGTNEPFATIYATIDGDDESQVEGSVVGAAATIDQAASNAESRPEEGPFRALPETPVAPINTVDEFAGARLANVAGVLSGEQAPVVVEGVAGDVASDVVDVVDVVVRSATETPTTSAGVVPVSISGTVKEDNSCSIGTQDDTVFDFGDIVEGSGEQFSGSVKFTVDCSDDGDATKIYTSTNGKDPQSEKGSNTLTVKYTPDGGVARDIELAVFNKSDETDIGNADNSSAETSGNGTKLEKASTTVELIAKIDTTTLDQAGSLGGEGEISVWFD